MVLVGDFGNLGSYKTSNLTAFARESSMRGVPVFANYGIDYPLCERLDIFGLLELDKVSHDRAFIAVDEIYTVAESRVSSSKLNLFFSYFIFQSRKLHKDVFYTAQLDSSVDLRVFLLTPVKIASYGLQLDGKTVKHVFVNENKKQKSVGIPLKFYQKYVWGHFDTDQPINPLGLEDLLISIELKSGEYGRINKRVDYCVGVLLEKAGFRNKTAKQIQKYNVDDFMLRLNLPLALAKFVCDRLKSQGTESRTEWWRPK